MRGARAPRTETLFWAERGHGGFLKEEAGAELSLRR